MSIAGIGNYTLTASDNSLTTAVSSGFYIGSTAYVNFNAGASTFTSQFSLNSAGVPGGTSLTWGAAYGVKDQSGGTAGGGVSFSGGGADQTAIYTPTTFNLSDGRVHTVSVFTTAPAGTGSGDKLPQLGFITTNTSGFNANFTFISTRILGNKTVEFQSNNGGSGATSADNTAMTGTVNTGDWLQLVFTTVEIASGSFQGAFSVLDYGPTGVSAPTTVLAPLPTALPA